MNNAEIFSQTFGIYATEMWAMPESEFLRWLNSLHDVNATNTTDTISREKLQTQLNCVDRLQITIDGRAIEVIPRWNVNKIIESLPSVETELKELSEWKADFKEYINALNMPRDDYNGIMEYIDAAPSAEPQIIRCKDCKYFSRTQFLGLGYNCGECHKGTAMRPGVGDVMRPDDYCSRAERE